jgi:CubicO group peptidase (beta-lactamase class C family)
MRKAALGLVCISLVATASWPGAAPAQDTARMDKIVLEHVDAKQFMGSVLVARGDQVLFSKGYGEANLEWHIPNTPTTKFRLGSVTKQFTAAGILLLEERGKLKVDDPIKKYLPDAPAAWDAIELEHLLTHTSGIANFTSLPEFEKRKMHAATVEEAISWFRDLPLEFAPGEKMAYSNSGYLLLGWVIEKVGGQSYAQFMQENIFTPLGMKDSGYDSNSAIIERRAAGYSPGPDGIVNADYVSMTIPHAAGALYSTTEDLLRWQRALYGNKLISADGVRRMTTPFQEGYGFGLAIAAGKRRIYQHGGGIEGFNTHLSYYPESDVTVAALGNLNGGAPSEIAGKLGALAHGDPVTLTSERKEITLSQKQLQRYVGTYSLAPNVDIMVTARDAQLYVQLSGQAKFPAYAESDRRFFLKVVNAQFEFFPKSGPVTHLVLFQNGAERKATRTSNTVIQRTEITLPESVLDRYVGTYELRPGFDIAITRQGSQLMLQATGQAVDPIYAEAQRKFFSKSVDATIEFEGPADSAATHLVLKQGAFNGKAPRK